VGAGWFKERKLLQRVNRLVWKDFKNKGLGESNSDDMCEIEPCNVSPVCYSFSLCPIWFFKIDFYFPHFSHPKPFIWLTFRSTGREVVRHHVDHQVETLIHLIVFGILFFFYWIKNVCFMIGQLLLISIKTLCILQHIV